ncbi:MAG TPA: adenylate kinase [Anaerolineales bacterium]|nr:adenylate kinase [Anaerolineales bacterium]
MATYIVLLGAPGVGKGTQAELLMKQTGLVHISSGDLFREHIKNKTKLGALAEGFMEKGELVPDDVTIKMIKRRLAQEDCEAGAILDGFPRNLRQAKITKEILSEIGEKISVVPYITASKKILIERLSGRCTCRAQGHTFHTLFNPPQKEGICDFDGSELYQRHDDTVETVEKRLQIYLDQTSPLIEYYRKEGKLVKIQGDQPIKDIAKDLLAVVKREL